MALCRILIVRRRCRTQSRAATATPRLTTGKLAKTDVTEKKVATPPLSATHLNCRGSMPDSSRQRRVAASKNSPVTRKSKGYWWTNTEWCARSGLSAVSAAASRARPSSFVRVRTTSAMTGMAAMPQANGRIWRDHSGSGKIAYSQRQMTNRPGATWIGTVTMLQKSARMMAP